MDCILLIALIVDLAKLNITVSEKLLLVTSLANFN